MANKNLNAAKEAKKDEFYTQLADIENELKHYREHFRGKKILCNCDDPYESNFFKYFANNFNAFGLKKLTATCYNGSPVQGSELMLDFGELNEEPKKIAYKVEITEVTDVNGDGRIDLADVRDLIQNDKNVLSILKENGDFRSQECVELLKDADIVVTNPPFSLFREYVALLMKFEKKFLILGPYNALHYKEIFPYIKNNNIWVGYTSPKQFIVPQEFERGNVVEIENRKVAKFGNIIWFTNLDIKKRHESLVLFKTYNEEEYPKYNNYDAINVNSISDIPIDYDGIMGVPDSFMTSFNPNQFEIIGLGSGKLASEIGVRKNYRGRTDIAYIENGVHKCPYSRILIRKKQ